MKKWGVIVLSLTLMVSYQNCAQNTGGQNEGAALTDGKLSESDYNKTPAKDFKQVTIGDYERGQFLDLDLSSGKLVSFEGYGEVRGDSYCLSDAEQKEVNDIISSSEVCEPIVKMSDLEGRICAMVYKYPYASLSDGSHEIRLGEKRDGCDIPIDLCEGKGALLKSFVQKILADLDSHKCN